MRRHDRVDLILDFATNNRVKCKCGHSVVIYPPVEKKICGWCGYYVYRDEKQQKKHDFELELKKRLKRG